MPTQAQKAEWKWHLWRKDTKTGLKSYCGFFYDEKAAIQGKKKRVAEDPNGIYAVLDYGPTDLARGTQRATSSRAATRPTSSAQIAMQEARDESRRRDAANVQARKEREAKVAANKAADREAMKGIREDAVKIIDQHKADEKADLDAGINR